MKKLLKTKETSGVVHAYSWFQQSYFVIAELQGGDGTEPDTARGGVMPRFRFHYGDIISNKLEILFYSLICETTASLTDT